VLQLNLGIGEFWDYGIGEELRDYEI
jgi:hypothetical protein